MTIQSRSMSDLLLGLIPMDKLFGGGLIITQCRKINCQASPLFRLIELQRFYYIISIGFLCKKRDMSQIIPREVWGNRAVRSGYSVSIPWSKIVRTLSASFLGASIFRTSSAQRWQGQTDLLISIRDPTEYPGLLKWHGAWEADWPGCAIAFNILFINSNQIKSKNQAA